MDDGFFILFNVKNDIYVDILNRSKMRLVKHNRNRENKVQITEGARKILDNFENDELDLMSELISVKK